MHTAFDFNVGHFDIEIEGRQASREDVLKWGPLDRLGIIIDRPYGAIGAGLLALLSATSFFDEPGKNRRRRPIYPETHLFHVGGPWGNFIGFDFFPSYKEIFGPGTARDILPVINSRGITHLVVPDRPRTPIVHRFKEAETALDRLKQAFAYSSDWAEIEGADVAITTRSAKVVENYETVLHIDGYLSGERVKDEKIPLKLQPKTDEERSALFQEQLARLDKELYADAPETARFKARLAAVKQAGELREEYRRISPEAALEMLAER